MKAKKGISLIVLVITIIVIIILAAAVILTLNNNNPISNANEATFSNDKAEVTSAISLYVGNYMANNNGKSPFQETAPTAETLIDVTGTTLTDRTTVENRNKLSWADIGMTGMPKSMKDVKYDIFSGTLTATSTK